MADSTSDERDAVSPTSEDVRRADQVIADMAVAGQSLTSEGRAKVRHRMVEMRLEIESGASLLNEVGSIDEAMRDGLLGIFEPSAAVSWLRGPNSYLGARPIDVLRAGRLEDFRDAVGAAEQTAYGG